jgi:hypothetical protein
MLVTLIPPEGKLEAIVETLSDNRIRFVINVKSN